MDVPVLLLLVHVANNSKTWYQRGQLVLWA
jgi:ACR3 family arsenite efflux pump ArsB